MPLADVVPLGAALRPVLLLMVSTAQPFAFIMRSRDRGIAVISIMIRCSGRISHSIIADRAASAGVPLVGLKGVSLPLMHHGVYVSSGSAVCEILI